MQGENLTFRLSPLAVSDLEEIWLYTFRQWSLEQADNYHRSIMRVIEGLAARRNVWQKSNIRAGYWKYPVGKHVIYFRNPDGLLDIIRILHKKMDINQRLEADVFDWEQEPDC